ncbi:hypothetical protein FB559_4911 [Actinoallomurus bryophytorum]|uniref:Uncharacterized protein n=1 Tax=Actinoallomurus bryophytorum TaxID=1490222 RepID=A0A543CQ74_9ACTN|nr:hypothetical protein FB559_4911 [Actinoallomurus bryophytorum]
MAAAAGPPRPRRAKANAGSGPMPRGPQRTLCRDGHRDEPDVHFRPRGEAGAAVADLDDLDPTRDHPGRPGLRMRIAIGSIACDTGRARAAALSEKPGRTLSSRTGMNRRRRGRLRLAPSRALTSVVPLTRLFVRTKVNPSNARRCNWRRSKMPVLRADDPSFGEQASRVMANGRPENSGKERPFRFSGTPMRFSEPAERAIPRPCSPPTSTYMWIESRRAVIAVTGNEAEKAENCHWTGTTTFGDHRVRSGRRANRVCRPPGHRPSRSRSVARSGPRRAWRRPRTQPPMRT